MKSYPLNIHFYAAFVLLTLNLLGCPTPRMMTKIGFEGFSRSIDSYILIQLSYPTLVGLRVLIIDLGLVKSIGLTSCRVPSDHRSSQPSPNLPGEAGRGSSSRPVDRAYVTGMNQLAAVSIPLHRAPPPGLLATFLSLTPRSTPTTPLITQSSHRLYSRMWVGLISPSLSMSVIPNPLG